MTARSSPSATRSSRATPWLWRPRAHQPEHHPRRAGGGSGARKTGGEVTEIRSVVAGTDLAIDITVGGDPDPFPISTPQGLGRCASFAAETASQRRAPSVPPCPRSLRARSMCNCSKSHRRRRSAAASSRPPSLPTRSAPSPASPPASSPARQPLPPLGAVVGGGGVRRQ